MFLFLQNRDSLDAQVVKQAVLEAIKSCNEEQE